MKGWDLSLMPSQAGRRAVVTGATGGLGYETALALAGAGAEVVVAARSAARGEQAVAAIRRAHPGARVRWEMLDLSRLDSVEAFAGRLLAAGEPLDLLINNAGVMALPERRTTADGFEMQLGTNYLGHFALTGRLLPLLRRAPAPRVVNVSSQAHRQGTMDFGDLMSTRYAPWAAYGRSKLAMILFTRELQRRSLAGGWGVTATAAHPGWARTDLIANGPSATGRTALRWRLAVWIAPLLSQSAADGALPTLYAATDPAARPGGYYGPAGLGELRGPPAPARLSAAARDDAAAARLWDESQRLTGVRFSASAPVPAP